jgi:hypothetical protein
MREIIIFKRKSRGSKNCVCVCARSLRPYTDGNLVEKKKLFNNLLKVMICPWIDPGQNELSEWRERERERERERGTPGSSLQSGRERWMKMPCMQASNYNMRRGPINWICYISCIIIFWRFFFAALEVQETKRQSLREWCRRGLYSSK